MVVYTNGIELEDLSANSAFIVRLVRDIGLPVSKKLSCLLCFLLAILAQAKCSHFKSST